MEKKKKLRSKEPYKIHTCTISEIMIAKAEGGNKEAKNVVEKMIKRGKKNGKANGYFRGSEQNGSKTTR